MLFHHFMCPHLMFLFLYVACYVILCNIRKNPNVVVQWPHSEAAFAMVLVFPQNRASPHKETLPSLPFLHGLACSGRFPRGCKAHPSHLCHGFFHLLGLHPGFHPFSGLSIITLYGYTVFGLSIHQFLLYFQFLATVNVHSRGLIKDNNG